MSFFLYHKRGGEELRDSRRESPEEIKELLESYSNHDMFYSIGWETEAERMLVEGLLVGDLDNILDPRLSVDEYVPEETDDNIVVAFFVRNAPEAAEPLKNFCTRFEGVVFTDHGDADSMKNTSIVYTEFKADTDVGLICKMVKKVAELADMDTDDMYITLPKTDKRIPYKPEYVERYIKDHRVAS